MARTKRRRLASSAPSRSASEDAANVASSDPPREISVRTDLARLLTSPLEVPVVQRLGGREDIWIVDGLLSVAECQALIAGAEAHGFGTTDFEQSYRGNLRLTASDAKLAKAVWHRLQPLLPAKVQMRPPQVAGDEKWWSSYPAVGGRWQAVGLNDCWRFAKYRPGDRFMCHCDSAFERTPGEEMSMFSCTIYLNTDFAGGQTRFYLNDDPYFEWREDFGKPDLEVVPKVGRCLLFRQPPGFTYWHDGEEVRSGLKYLLRSDVLYQKC
eukprot:TRINITY_DN62200_c0_g1_i1.p1 TRINITY_DN62200_c0_g1~~TRINITY_DN62200_c0_g1_i1.p1  ORF type:complete len:298 (-),score=48.97 TRINITY_DN62200_c0_g1_i1:355-1158(-)